MIFRARRAKNAFLPPDLPVSLLNLDRLARPRGVEQSATGAPIDFAR